MEAVKGIKAGLVETSGGQEINRGMALRTVHDIPSHPRTAKARTSEEVGLCQVFLILNTVRISGNSYSTPNGVTVKYTAVISVCQQGRELRGVRFSGFNLFCDVTKVVGEP